jgi:predicted transcriptional regulator
MTTLTIRLPDKECVRLRALAKAKDISVNTRIDQLAGSVGAGVPNHFW